MQLVNETVFLFQKMYTAMARENCPKITVSAIAKRAGTSRGTFYLYYNSIDQLREDISQRLLDKLHKHRPLFQHDVSSTTRAYIRQLSEYTIKYQDELYALLIYDHSDVFASGFKDFLKRGIILCRADQKTFNEETLEYLTVAAVSIIIQWLSTPNHMDTQLVDQLALDLMLNTTF